jgi:hypothetical protein
VYDPLGTRRSVIRLVVRSYLGFCRAVRLEYRGERPVESVLPEARRVFVSRVEDLGFIPQ